jgi:hypothetical protein
MMIQLEDGWTVHANPDGSLELNHYYNGTQDGGPIVISTVQLNQLKADAEKAAAAQPKGKTP